ncbi:MAG TPA: hypothetical protein VGO34_10950 [Alphaproteobacteria bacterium]|jgi:tetratricopeptide (TPR) repeat protein
MPSLPAALNLFLPTPRLARRLALAALLLTAAAPAWADEQVAVRVGEHPGFGRLVFEWAAPVDYKAAIEGNALVLHFDRPFAGALDSVPRRLSNYVEQPQLADDGKTVTFPLKAALGLKSYADGKTVVIDLVDNKAAAASSPAPAPAQVAQAAPAVAADAVPAPVEKAEAKPAPAKAAAPKAAPKLAVRPGDHPGFGRLVFDWPRNVEYDAVQTGDTLSIRFDAPATIDVDRLTPKLPKTVQSLSADSDANSLTVTMAVPPGAQMRHFRNGPSIVVDIVGDAPPPAADKQTAKAGEAKPQTEQKPEQKPEAKAAPQETAKAEPQPEAKPAAKPDAKGEAKPEAKSADADLPKYELVPVGHAASAPPRSLLTPAATTPAAVNAPTPASAPANATAGAPLPQAAISARKLVVSTLGTAPAISGLRFAWPADAPAAVFERNGALWAVFDRAASADIANNWPRTVGRPDLFSSAVSSIVRFPMPADRYPSLRRDGANLVVDFTLTPALPGAQIGFEAQPAADVGPRVLLKSAAFGPVIETRDPDVGDKLWVVPTMPIEGLAGERRFVEFQVLPSLQGVAVKALTDDLVVRGALEGAEIVAPGGLRLSGALAAASPAVQAAASPETTRMATQSGATVPLPALAVNTNVLFDFVGWSQFGGKADASFFERKANLQRAVIDAPRATRNSARLALARFMFANGQAADALGILQVMEEDEPEVARDPSFIALRGASRYLMGDYAGAGPDLFHNSLDMEREAALWRGALLANQNDWIASARYFARAENMLRSYPPEMQLPFGLLAAEAALSTGDVGQAKFQLDALNYLKPARPWLDQIDYLRGEILLKAGETEGALAAWDRAINGLDKQAKARARLARVETLLGNKTMKLQDGIAELERLRYGWRGDEIELTVLRRLGELYIEAGDYKNGLATLRDALTQFPKASETTAIAQRMRDSFAELYIGGAADKMPPLTALGIYEDFRDLMPQGDAGNLLIAKLADRLVQIELLDRAEALLKGQIDTRLKGGPQAEAADQLALIYLLDRKPEEALKTLSAALPGDASDSLKSERRQLQARTLGELTRYDEALALLKGDDTADAARLRAEIGWRTQNWPLAASGFVHLVPTLDHPLSDAERQTVLRLAIAQSLSQDTAGLSALRATYGADMAKSAFKESFDLITAANIASNFDMRSISRQVAGVDQFGAFMTGYRDKILKSRTAAAARKGGASQAANAAAPATAGVN